MVRMDFLDNSENKSSEIITASSAYVVRHFMSKPGTAWNL